MATKKSVFLSDFTAEWIALTTEKAGFDTGVKWSESINATFEQFRYLLRENVPELSADEWMSLLNIFNGSVMPAHATPANIASLMMDDAGALELSELTEEYAAMVRKIHGLSQLEQMAVTYICQIFWSKKWNENSYEETISKIIELI